MDQSEPTTVLGGITKKGSPYMRRVLCQVSQSVSINGAAPLRGWFLQVARHRGRQKAIVALAWKILVIVSTMLSDGACFVDPEAMRRVYLTLSGEYD